MLRSAVRFGACVVMVLTVRAQQAPADPAAMIDALGRQTEQLANAWLKSDDPRTQAWGAYLALRDRQMGAIRVLLDMLAQYPLTGEGSDRHDVAMEVLDALIQLGANVPVDEAQRIYPEFPVQSLILLSRAKIDDAAPALFSIFNTEKHWPVAWLAAGNLLAMQTYKGFAATVVEGMTVHGLVTVIDPDHPLGGGSGGSCAFGDRSFPKDGWPPVGLYTFGPCSHFSSSFRGAMTLAGGTDPATYDRTVGTSYRADEGPACECRLDRDLVRQHYLTRLVGAQDEAPPIHAHVSQTIKWQSADQYLRDLSSFVDGQEQEFGELNRRLALWQLFDEEEVKNLRPTLQLEIQDRRVLQGPALPAPGPLPANVSITTNGAK